jgi:hypothetical protein
MMKHLERRWGIDKATSLSFNFDSSVGTSAAAFSGGQ